MAVYEHITIQDLDTKTNLMSNYNSPQTAIQGHFYYATDTDEYYYGKSDGSLAGPLPSAGSVTGFNDTNSVDFTDQGSGTWTADVKLSADSGQLLEIRADGLFADAPADFITSLSNTNSINLTESAGDLTADVNVGGQSDNIVQVTASGVYVPDIAIASGSSSYLSYDSGTRELSISNLLINDVFVDSTSADLSTFVTNNYSAGNEYQEGDTIILTTPDPTETYIHNGGSAGTTADFTKVSVDNVTDSYIRGLLSGGNGIDYASGSGQISVDLSGDAGNDLSFGGDTGVFVDVSTSDITDTEGLVVSAGTDTTLQNLMDEVANLINTSSLGSLGSGRVVYTDANGNLTSAAELVYDDTNDELGLTQADLVYSSSGQGTRYVSGDGTTYKQSVTNYGAIVMTSV